MDAAHYRSLIVSALAEDLGEAGDVTTQAIFSDQHGRAVLVSKDRGVLAGSQLFIEVYKQLDPAVKVDFEYPDGADLRMNEVVAHLEGKTVSLLGGERVALNFLSYLSGIASATRRYVEAAGGGRGGGEPAPISAGVAGEVSVGFPAVLDTRKTLPGYRMLAKYAVTVGGGRNHRLGLYDMILIKDNHIDFAGSISSAVERVRARWGSRFVVEVECRTIEEVDEAVGAGVDIIMLDNMDLDRVTSAVGRIARRTKVEVSGNVNLEKIAGLASSGVDFVSVGRLTHSVEAFDFSLKVESMV